MVRKRKTKGMGPIARDHPQSKRSVQACPEIVPVSGSVSGSLSGRIEAGSRVEFLVERGVVEIHDPRLFHAGQEPFCLAMVEEAVGPGRARRAEVRLNSASCRMEFEPGRFDRDELAKKVASALKTASSMSLDRVSEVAGSGPSWTTLTALAAADGASIWETLVDFDGRVVCRRRSARRTPRVSEHSGRPLRNQPQRVVRPASPRARQVIVHDSRDAIEPINLAMATGPIFRRSLLRPARETLPAEVEARSKRVVNLALAGGSFAMAIAGVVLPGIPALPFLLLSGHYLIRSSPALCHSLETLPGIGVLLRRAEEMGGQIINRRSLLKMLGVTILTASAFLILHPPLPLVILLETGIMAYYGLRELRKPSNALEHVHSGRLALT